MSLLTVFTAPKPFTDAHIATIQRNAIRSWLALGDEAEVLLVGEEAGMAEVAAEYGVRHLREVKRNEMGTPLVSSVFRLARDASHSLLLAYVNADILLLPETVEIARKVMSQCGKFVLIGQRWDLDVKAALDFQLGWDEALKRGAQARGRLHPPAGSDYFIFPHGLYTDIPDFAIGRAGWDNWMIYFGTTQLWPVIDATPSLMVIHQNHDYAHLPSGRPHYDLEESQSNAQMGGGMQNMYIVLDADKELVNGRVRRPRPRLLRLIRRLERRFQPPQETGYTARWAVTRRLRRLRRALVGSRS